MIINPFIFAAPFTNLESLLFDGVDDHVTMGNPTELQITGAMSVSFWFKSSDTTDQIAVAKDAGANRCFAIWTNDWSTPQTIGFYIYSSGGNASVGSSTNYNDGNWHHVMCVFIPSTSIKIYVDGVLDGSNTTSIPATIDNDPAPFSLGTTTGSGFAFGGNLDEVAIWNTDLTSSVSAIYNLGVPNSLLSLNPVGYWRVDGSTYPTITDTGSGGNDGTMTNMSSSDIVNDVPPTFNTKSLLFDGVDDYVDLGTPTALNLIGEMTASLWIKPISTALKFVAGQSNAGAGNYQWFIDINRTSGRISIGTLNAVILTSSTALSVGTWYHIAFTRTGSTGNWDYVFYLNGVNDGSVTGSTVNPGTQERTCIGRIGDLNGYYFNGNLDEVAIWNTALTSGNVSAIWNLGVPNSLLSLNPVGYWRVDGSTYPTITDTGSGGNNGTMTNMSSSDIVNDVP